MRTDRGELPIMAVCAKCGAQQKCVTTGPGTNKAESKARAWRKRHAASCIEASPKDRVL